jgi:hypothetical protein
VKNLAKNLLKTPKRIVTEPFPGVLAVAGTSVLAFRNLVSIGDHSFWDVHVGLLEGRGPGAVPDEYEQGFSGSRMKACRIVPILSKTAGARGKTKILSTA